jgi:hypothetical protein
MRLSAIPVVMIFAACSASAAPVVVPPSCDKAAAPEGKWHEETPGYCNDVGTAVCGATGAMEVPVTLPSDDILDKRQNSSDDCCQFNSWRFRRNANC